MAINFSAIHDDANCTAKPSEFISTPTFNTYVHTTVTTRSTIKIVTGEYNPKLDLVQWELGHSLASLPRSN